MAVKSVDPSKRLLVRRGETLKFGSGMSTQTGLSASRRRLLIAGAALPAACAAPVARLAPPAVAPPLPQLRVGQRWRYERIDGYRRVPIGELLAEVVSVDAIGPAPLRIALHDERGASRGEEHWLRPWWILVDPSYDVVQVFETPMPYLPDVLAPGVRRNDATGYRVPNNSFRHHWGQSLRAIGWERVVVPAGSFDALRVERFIRFQHFDTWREMPWRIDTIWYAPSVGRWVQREWHGRYRWPSGRQSVEAEEDRVAWRLLGWDA